MACWSGPGWENHGRANRAPPHSARNAEKAGADKKTARRTLLRGSRRCWPPAAPNMVEIAPRLPSAHESPHAPDRKSSRRPADLLATSDLDERERRWGRYHQGRCRTTSPALRPLFRRCRAAAAIPGLWRCGRTFFDLRGAGAPMPEISLAGRRPAAKGPAIVGANLGQNFAAFVIGDPVRLPWLRWKTWSTTAVKFTEGGSVAAETSRPLRRRERQRSVFSFRGFPTAASVFSLAENQAPVPPVFRRPMSRSRSASAAPGLDCRR